jgi:predicted ATPase
VDALVVIELMDEAGNRFNFDEVGSGIGYVLPILVAIVGHRRCLIQQPELHLHPALQGSLSDTFISACHEGRRLVVESHSEHLLLRALRRVRETGAGKAASPALSIAAEDVCVLYFEPVADGTTRVRHIRVAPDGDLMDRWPGGFFAERDKDLFDE